MEIPRGFPRRFLGKARGIAAKEVRAAGRFLSGTALRGAPLNRSVPDRAPRRRPDCPHFPDSGQTDTGASAVDCGRRTKP